MEILQNLILKTLVDIINDNYKNNKNSIELFCLGVGKFGYDFSCRAILHPLCIFYDAETDCRLYIYYDAYSDSFIIKYSEINIIENNLDISINVEQEKLDHLMADELKSKAISNFTEKNNKGIITKMMDRIEVDEFERKRLR